MGGARQLIGFLVYQSSLLCKNEERCRRKEGRHLGQASGSYWEEQKGWSRLWGEDIAPTPVLPAAVEQLHPGPNPVQNETLVLRPSLKYGQLCQPGIFKLVRSESAFDTSLAYLPQPTLHQALLSSPTI